MAQNVCSCVQISQLTMTRLRSRKELEAYFFEQLKGQLTYIKYHP